MINSRYLRQLCQNPYSSEHNALVEVSQLYRKEGDNLTAEENKLIDNFIQMVADKENVTYATADGLLNQYCSEVYS